MVKPPVVHASKAWRMRGYREHKKSLKSSGQVEQDPTAKSSRTRSIWMLWYGYITYPAYVHGVVEQVINLMAVAIQLRQHPAADTCHGIHSLATVWKKKTNITQTYALIRFEDQY
ncbi:hypothetical protein BTVI_65113 [Pitangus sulphuratus]|nr:hypothetical protein BTVI_65113 [Pitangus sulphuratus]